MKRILINKCKTSNIIYLLQRFLHTNFSYKQKKTAKTQNYVLAVKKNLV